MVPLDFILLAPLLFGIIRGFFNGLIKEIVSLIAIILGVFIAFKYAKGVQNILANYITAEELTLSITAYLLIFAAVMLIAFSLSFLITKILQAMALGLLNRFLGALFGLAKSALILLVLVNSINPYLQATAKESVDRSKVYQIFVSFDFDWIILSPEKETQNATNPQLVSIN